MRGVMQTALSIVASVATAAMLGCASRLQESPPLGYRFTISGNAGQTTSFSANAEEPPIAGAARGEYRQVATVLHGAPICRPPERAVCDRSGVAFVTIIAPSVSDIRPRGEVPVRALVELYMNATVLVVPPGQRPVTGTLADRMATSVTVRKVVGSSATWPGYPGVTLSVTLDVPEHTGNREGA